MGGKYSDVCNFEMHQKWDGQMSDRVSTDRPNGRIWVVGVQGTGYKSFGFPACLKTFCHKTLGVKTTAPVECLLERLQGHNDAGFLLSSCVFSRDPRHLLVPKPPC